MKCLYCDKPVIQDHPKHFFCKGTFCYHAYAEQWRAVQVATGRQIRDTAFGMLGGFGFMGDRRIIQELHRHIDEVGRQALTKEK